MKKADVEIGGVYMAKVSGNLTRVQIDAVCDFGGWTGTNLRTGREVRIRSARQLRCTAENYKKALDKAMTQGFTKAMTGIAHNINAARRSRITGQ